MKVKFKIKSNTKVFKKILNEVKKKAVNVGYIDSKDHWTDKNLSVADVAIQLHYWSDWGRENINNGFMLDNGHEDEIKLWATKNLKNFGTIPFSTLLNMLGKDLANQIARNILETDSPPNSEEWASQKGFNNPLMYGSEIGHAPNLMSELTHKVVNK